MRRFGSVSTISERMLDRLEKKTSKSNGILFENWVDTDKIYPLDQRPPLHDGLALPESKKIILSIQRVELRHI